VEYSSKRPYSIGFAAGGRAVSRVPEFPHLRQFSPLGQQLSLRAKVVHQRLWVHSLLTSPKDPINGLSIEAPFSSPVFAPTRCVNGGLLKTEFRGFGLLSGQTLGIFFRVKEDR
jgi:hypothetical protein